MASVSKEESFVAGLVQLGANLESARGVISMMRTLGYINEQEYSKMNTALSRSRPTVRHDGAETIELSRDPETILPSEP